MDYETELTRLMGVHPEIFVLTAENKGPCIHVGEAFPQRYLDCGIAEQSLVGIAAGLARMGYRPVVHAMAAFLTMRAFEFIRTDVGLLELPVKLVGTASGLMSEGNGPTHQGVEDLALMRAIPSMNIFCPADIEEMVLALPMIFADTKPWYIRYNTLPARVTHAPFEIGKAEVFGEGREVAILTCGLLLSEAIVAQALLAEQGVAVRVVNMRCVRPLDDAAIIDAAATCGRVLTLEDHLRTGGLFSAVAEKLTSYGQAARLTSLALSTYFAPAPLNVVLGMTGLDAQGIVAAVTKSRFPGIYQ